MTDELFTLEDGRKTDYRRLLFIIQKELSSDDGLSPDNTDRIIPELTQRIIRLFKKKHIQSDRELHEVAEDMAQDMAGYSVLSRYLDHLEEYPTLEEININAWNSIWLKFNDGTQKQLKETFLSPSHVVEVVNKINSKNRSVRINESIPASVGYITESVRMTDMCAPLAEKEANIYASIRIVRPNVISKEKLIETESYSPEMIDFITACIKYCANMLIGGKPGSGKTTLLNYLLNIVASDENVRIGTIEEGSRELSILRRGADARPLNQVLSVLTKPNDDDKKLNFDANKILELFLRFDLDYIIPQEMRSLEAYIATEAAATGAGVFSTIHINNVQAAYPRVVTLMQKISSQPYSVLLQYAVQAYPIIVYLKQLPDKTRRCMAIQEGYCIPGKAPVYRTLYRYVIEDNSYESGNCRITGHFEKINGISEYLQELLLNNGAPRKLINQFV